MACQTFHDDQGKAIGIVCGPRTRRPRCSTKGCRKSGSLECDAPVEKAAPSTPHRGDARLHKVHKVIFYVWRVNLDGAGTVVVSTSSPDTRRLADPKEVSFADWFAKTSATCNAPICADCAVRVGRLDVCVAHGRELEGGHHG